MIMDLLFLLLGGKNVLLHTQRKKVLQVFNSEIVEASLPFPNVASRDPLEIGQAGLRQANAGPQLEHSLPKGIVVLTIGVPGHGLLLAFYMTRRHPAQECEAKGMKDATLL